MKFVMSVRAVSVASSSTARDVVDCRLRIVVHPRYMGSGRVEGDFSKVVFGGGSAGRLPYWSSWVIVSKKEGANRKL